MTEVTLESADPESVAYSILNQLPASVRQFPARADATVGSPNDDVAGALAHFVEGLDRLEHPGEERAGISDRLDALKSVLAEATTALGFKHVTYHLVRSSCLDGVASKLPFIISNYPDSWVRHYFRERYLVDDPVVDEFMERRMPFIWSELPTYDDLSRRQRRLFDEARDAGLTDGMTVPIHSGGDIAAITLVPEGSGERASGLMRSHRHLVFLMAQRYHNLACRVLLERALTGDSSRRRSVLSDREREVLTWSARGKSNWEIATILDISVKSVEFHMEGAKRKLQVFNRTHAVVKAMMLGLLPFT